MNIDELDGFRPRGRVDCFAIDFSSRPEPGVGGDLNRKTVGLRTINLLPASSVRPPVGRNFGPTLKKARPLPRLSNSPDDSQALPAGPLAAATVTRLSRRSNGRIYLVRRNWGPFLGPSPLGSAFESPKAAGHLLEWPPSCFINQQLRPSRSGPASQWAWGALGWAKQQQRQEDWPIRSGGPERAPNSIPISQSSQTPPPSGRD